MPDEPEDKDEFEDEDGCPDPDNDKDGVLDEDDKCPNEPETKNGYQDDDGCPDEVPAPVKKFTGVVKGINFRRNSADIKASSFPLLKEAVSVFKEYPALRVEISGHTSNEGKRDFNMKLSRKRAEAVKLFLVSAGIDESRIGTVGYGPDKPIATTRPRTGRKRTVASSSGCSGPRRRSRPSPSPRTSTRRPTATASPRARVRPRRRGRGRRPREGEGQGEEGEGARRPTAIRCRRRSLRPRTRPRQGEGRPRRQGRPQGESRPRRQGRAQGQGRPQRRALDPVPSPREAAGWIEG